MFQFMFQLESSSHHSLDKLHHNIVNTRSDEGEINEANVEETANPLPNDSIQPRSDLPIIGKWMITADNTVANWLNDRLSKWGNKQFAEPINVIIKLRTDDISIAKQKFSDVTSRAGFPYKWGHSSSYQGLISGSMYSEYPNKATCAYSDSLFLLPNNHGRCFGPSVYNSNTYFVCAFSREDVTIKILPKFVFRHPFDSFLRARDTFATRMTKKNQGQVVNLGKVDMKNKIDASDPNRTTGDHDSEAVLLEVL